MSTLMVQERYHCLDLAEMKDAKKFTFSMPPSLRLASLATLLGTSPQSTHRNVPEKGGSEIEGADLIQEMVNAQLLPLDKSWVENLQFHIIYFCTHFLNKREVSSTSGPYWVCADSERCSTSSLSATPSFATVGEFSFRGCTTYSHLPS